MQEMKKRYDAVNSQLGSLETRMDSMRRDQAEKSCAIQAKLDAILRNSTSQDKPVTDRTQSTRVDFVERQRNKRESTPLPLTRDAAITAPGGGGAQRTLTRATEEMENQGKLSKNRKNSRMIQTDALILG